MRQLFGAGRPACRGRSRRRPRAWLLGCTRKSCSLIDRRSAAPIRSLRYFVPLLEEVLAESFPTDYWSHLQFNVGRCEERRHRNPGTTPGRAQPKLEQAARIQRVAPYRRGERRRDDDAHRRP